MKRKKYYSTLFQDQYSGMDTYILLANAFICCDTNSAIHGQDKSYLWSWYLVTVPCRNVLTLSIERIARQTKWRKQVKSYSFIFTELRHKISLSMHLAVFIFRSLWKGTHPTWNRFLLLLLVLSDVYLRHIIKSISGLEWNWNPSSGHVYIKTKNVLLLASDEIIKFIPCSSKSYCSLEQISCKKSWITLF